MNRVRGLGIVPNNCATKALCARCGITEQMPTPFAVFTAEDEWVCSACASHEWELDVGATLDRLYMEQRVPPPEGVKELPPEGRGWRMICDRWEFRTDEVNFGGDELVRLTVRHGLGVDLARIITEELMRRYANRTPELPF